MSFLSDFVDGITGKTAKEAANAAAEDTYRKQQAAVGSLQTAGGRYAGDMRTLGNSFAPYATAGGGAIDRLMSGLGIGGGDPAAFTAAYRALPGYQAGLDMGIDAINRRRAAGGMLNSGNADRDAQVFGSDYEDQRVGSYMDRLMGLAGMGQNATGQQVATTAQGLTGQLGADQTAFGGQMQGAQTIGQGMIAGANAEAAGMQNILNVAGYLGGQAISAFGAPKLPGGTPASSPASAWPFGKPAALPAGGWSPYSAYGAK